MSTTSFKRMAFALLLAAGITLVAVSPAQAANLVTNPGFETGATATPTT